MVWSAPISLLSLVFVCERAGKGKTSARQTGRLDKSSNRKMDKYKRKQRMGDVDMCVENGKGGDVYPD